MNELFVSNLISKEMNDVILFQHLLKISTRYFISHDLVGVGFYFIRFLDQDLDDIGGIPRLLDAGRCNDAYSDIRIASALAHAFGVIDLPLFRIISW